MGWIVVGVLFAASLAYSYYVGQKASQTAQKPGTVATPTASEGIPIPVVFGTRQVTDPNICWFGDLGTEKDGNTYKYYAGIQHAICHGKLDKIHRVIIAEKASQSGLSGGAANQTIAPARDLSDPSKNEANDFVSGIVNASYGAANTAGTVDDGTPLYPGTDDYLAKQMGITGSPFKGPRYYGIATVTAKHCWLGNSPYLKPWGFLVSRIHTRDAGRSTQWYDAKAEITVGRTFDGLWKYHLRSISDEVSEDEYAGIGFDDSAWPSAPGGIGNAPTNQYMGDWNSFNQSTMDYPVPPVVTQLAPDGTIIKGIYPHNWVQDLARLWMRADLGALPEYQLNVRCHHDDAARLWFNGTEITLTPMSSATSKEYSHFNSSAVIPASLINPSGPNIVAYKVINGQAAFGASSFIFGSITVGVDASSETAIVADMNPAHIIRECITDTIWGMGWPESMVDDVSFTAAADTLYSEGFGLSIEWNRQGAIGDFLEEVLRAVGGNLYIDRSSGKWVLKLVRDDYDANTIVSLGEADIAKVSNATRKAPSEIVNSVTITYSATARGDKGSVTLYDEGLFQVQDGTVSQTIDYPGVRNPATASRLALRDLRMLSSSLFSCSLECSRKAATLQIGDPFLLNWPDLYVVDMVCRVSSIDIGNHIDGTVKIECVEDVFSYPKHPVTVPSTPITKDQPPSTMPIDMEQYQTALCIDERNKGSAQTIFNGSAFGAGGGVFAGWTETSPGVMVRDTAGPLTSGMFDDVDPFTGSLSGGGYTTGQTQYVGFRVFALSGAGDVPGSGQQYQGPYIIDDLGWDPVNLAATHARMHRDQSFSSSEQFVQNMILQARSGTTYGGHYFQLATANVVLGQTEQTWTHIIPAALTWNDTYGLLRSDELGAVATSPDSALMITATGSSGSSDFGEKFRTRVGTPGTDAIPAGPWRFTFGPAKVDGGSVGSTTTLGVKICKNTDLSHPLFEIQTGALVDGVWTAPGAVQVQLPQYLISKDQLALVPTVNTDSSTAVTVSLLYNSINAVKVSMPKGTNTIGATKPDEDWFDVTIVGGLISGFGDHRRLRVHGTGPLQAISIGGLGSAANLLMHFVADTVVSANNAVTGGAGIITSKDGETTYQDRFYPADSFVSMALIASGTVIYWKTA